MTHLAGAILAAAGLAILVVGAVRRGTVWHVTSFAVFGASLMLLYTASSLYHLLRLPPRGVRALRRLDHIMIYVLIAGTYTPFCLVPLRGGGGWALFGTVWGLALAGIILKIAWMEAPAWLSVLTYVGMGWLSVLIVAPLARAVAPATLWWLVAGGLAYTAGVVFYAERWPSFFRGRLTSHDVWHLFVMAGSVGHYFAVLGLLS